jgi:hypothetical protein
MPRVAWHRGAFYSSFLTSSVGQVAEATAPRTPNLLSLRIPKHYPPATLISSLPSRIRGYGEGPNGPIPVVNKGYALSSNFFCGGGLIILCKSRWWCDVTRECSTENPGEERKNDAAFVVH